MGTGSVTFATHPPPNGTIDTIQSIWMASGRGGGPFRADPVAPDGCIELVVNLADPFASPSAGGVDAQPLLLVVGQMTGPSVVGPTGRVDVVGIRLRTERSGAWPGETAWDLRDRVMPADALLGPSVGELADALSHGRTAAERLEAIARYWRAHAARFAQERTPVIDWAVKQLRQSGGTAAIETLSGRAGMSRRHLERLFRRHVGLTPKEFGRIVRMQRALAILAAMPAGRGAAVAAACGYSDQPHMIRELGDLAGVRPGALELRAFGPGLSTTSAVAGSPAVRETHRY